MTVSDMAGAVKTAMVTAATTACTPLADPAHQLVVCYGHPGKQLPDDIVSVGRVTVAQVEGPLSNAKRIRDVTITIDVTASVWRKGGPEQEQIAGDAAHAYITAVEEYVRVTDTTLGGLVWWCFCTAVETDGVTDPALLASGRAIEVVATFTAQGRITS